MKLVQIIFLFLCIVTGEGRAADIVGVGTGSESLSTTSITLDSKWLQTAAQSSGIAQVNEWNLSGENQHDGCGFLCTTITTPEPQKAAHMKGLVKLEQVGKQLVTVNGGNVNIRADFSEVAAHVIFYAGATKLDDQYLRDINNIGQTVDSGYQTACFELGCNYTMKTGFSGGKVALSISIPDLAGVKSFSIPETTIANVTLHLFSDNAGAGINNEKIFEYKGEIKLPALTINLPERCYTTLSGNTVTFKNDIDASTITTTGATAVDTKSITLTAHCNTTLLSKNVHASVKLMQVNGVEDNYKFKLTPQKNDYNLTRTLSVVAKHISSGSAGASTCDKDGNTMENNKLYYVGKVAFPGQSNGGLNDPYNITFNLCAFKKEGDSDLLPPGEYTGAVKVITRFYTADY